MLTDTTSVGNHDSPCRISNLSFLFINSAFLNRLYHSAQVIRVPLIYTGPSGQDKAAAFAANLNEFTAIFLHHFRCARSQQRSGYVTGNTGCVTQHLFSLEHVRTVEIPGNFSFRQVLYDFQSIIITAFGEQVRHESFFNQSHNYLTERWPVKFFILLLGHKGIIAFVKRKEYYRYTGGISHLQADFYIHRRQHLHSFQEFFRLPVHIHHNSPGAPQGISQNVKRGMGLASKKRWVSCCQNFTVKLHHWFLPLNYLFTIVYNRLIHLLDFRQDGRPK